MSTDFFSNNSQRNYHNSSTHVKIIASQTCGVLLRHNACTEGKESMFRLEQDENSLDQVLAGDVVLYVVRVMLNAERQQFHND